MKIFSGALSSTAPVKFCRLNLNVWDGFFPYQAILWNGLVSYHSTQILTLSAQGLHQIPQGKGLVPQNCPPLHSTFTSPAMCASDQLAINQRFPQPAFLGSMYLLAHRTQEIHLLTRLLRIRKNIKGYKSTAI